MTVTRFSRQREAILAALRERCDHPTAETLYHELRKLHPNISLGTVYRNLSLLESQGDVLRIPDQEGPDRYDGTTHPHDHLFCRACGAVIDLPSMEDTINIDKARQAAKRQGMVLESYHVSFYGVCQACKTEAH